MLTWLIPGLFALIYALFGGIEFALPVFRLATRNKQDLAVINRWFSPVWEVTNVFLVMALTGFAAVFPLILPILTPVLRWWILLAGLGLGIRALIVLVIFYGQAKSWVGDWALAGVSLAIPAILAQVVLNLIAPDVHLAQAGVAAFVAIFMSLALGSGFLMVVGSDKRYRRIAAVSVLLAAGSSYVLGHFPSLVPVVQVVLGGAVLVAISILTIRYRWTALVANWLFLILIFVRILIRQWPYVIYQSVSYGQVAASPSIHRAILWGMGAGIVLSLPGLVWLVIVLSQNFQQEN